MTAALSGLAVRAVMAARRARDTDPDGFPERYRYWHTWQRRAQLARTLATMRGAYLDTDDPAHHPDCGFAT